MPAFCKAEYVAMLARAHVHNCIFQGNQGLGFEEGTTWQLEQMSQSYPALLFFVAFHTHA